MINHQNNSMNKSFGWHIDGEFDQSDSMNKKLDRDE